MHRKLILMFLISTLFSGCRLFQERKPEVVIMKENSYITCFGEFEKGTRDATEAIQSALTKAGQKGGEVFVPPGRYRLDGSLTVPSGVTLKGSWNAPHHARLKTGTVFLVYAGKGKEEGSPLISLEPGSCISGFTIYYPEQNIEDVKPYPWTIRGRGMHTSVMNVTLVNPYKGIDMGTKPNELHYLKNIFGCPLKIGVYVNGCTDIGRIENVHFNPHYWIRDEGDGEPRPPFEKVMNYLKTEGEGFIFGRTDWEYVFNTFCYGYRIGYHFIATKQGVCNGNFLGIGADGTRNAVVVDAAAPYGLLITNGEFVSMLADDPVQVLVNSGNTGVVQFHNCAFWGPASQIARLEGGATSFVQCNFHFWGYENKRLPAIEANRGSLILQNCFFHQDFSHISLGEEMTGGIVDGNIMKGKVNIENKAGDKVKIGDQSIMK